MIILVSKYKLLAFYFFKYLICSLLGIASFTVPSVLANHHDAFWPLQEYWQQYPQQQKLSQAFAERVRLQSQPFVHSQDIPVKIFVIYPGKQISDYWRRSIESFTARLKEAGIKYHLQAHHTKPASALEQQQRLLQKAHRFQPDYIIFTLDAKQHGTLIERILQLNTTKLILQNITTPVKTWPRQPFLYVGFDHATGTQLLANYYQARTDFNDQFATVMWSPGYISDARGHYFNKVMQQQSDLTLTDSYYTKASRRSAYKSAKQILIRHPKVKFIYASATDVAFGVLDAIKEQNRQGEVMLNGWGGGESELQALLAGEIDVTVMRMNDDNGVAMADAIQLDLEGQGALVPQIYSGDFVVVDKHISRVELEQLKARAFRYSQ
ncbi:substrate-binding domain-containing protein [Motilimonas pumila]|uniref:ABC transporter substrate-binding protein n=1 Tax=Motilimonas pumila TaxID=2303987 RepID=A0A418YBP7_9GAMM|nr:substrate-binding domain-containing protein [Motilimonas pumila]RJG41938.1 ABC transporter substrate-binding protein [Motilimonas pumila]